MNALAIMNFRNASRRNGLHHRPPDLDLMGLKKRPAKTDALWTWLFEQASDADGAVLGSGYPTIWGHYPFETASHDGRGMYGAAAVGTKIETNEPWFARFRLSINYALSTVFQ